MSSPHVLPAELTIYTVGELRPQWLAWLDPAAAAWPDPLVLDASPVAEVDAAGVQLLQSLANTLAQRQGLLRLDSPSRALVQACAALGLAALTDDVPTQAVPA